jgi:hypothetical protein
MVLLYSVWNPSAVLALPAVLLDGALNPLAVF